MKISMFFYILMILGCGEQKNNELKRNSSETDSNVNQNQKIDEKQVGLLSSMEAFQKTFHPLMIEKCGSCHASKSAPFISSKEAKKAYEESFVSGKVSFITPASSSIVLKIKDGKHNCWQGGCEENAKTIINSIENWIKLTKKDEIDKLKAEFTKNKTASIKFVDGKDLGLSSVAASFLAAEAEGETGNTSVTITGNYIKQKNLLASNGEIITTNNDNKIFAQNDTTAGVITIKFKVTQAGRYNVYARALVASKDDNELFVQINNQTMATWVFPVSTSTQFEWVKANTGTADLGFTLQAGDHTLRLKVKKDGLKLDVIALTLGDFKGDSSVSRVRELTFDLKPVLKDTDASLSIQVRQFDKNSYIFSKPIIKTNENILVKNIKVFVNNTYFAKYATFSLINQTIEAPGGQPFSTSTMIVNFDKGLDTDQFSFQFEELKTQ